ncbi:MAG: peptidase [Steroidobacteraceae bacterium]|nr:peptidase [Steroidobacteraceae bacterium]
MRHATLRNTLILIALALLAACSVNPVTGKNELMLVGEGTELQIGEKNFAPTRQSQGGDQQLDPGLTAYVQGVGQRLAAVSDRKLPYEFAVLNNSIPNAWALPGGKISVNRGLLTELKSESELAAVLGHEIVHAAARHSAQAMSRGMLIQGGLIVAQVAAHDSDYGNIAMMGAGLGAQLLTQRYSREAELEADKYGIDYMKRTGYDAQGAVSLQETFVRLNDSKESSWLSGMFASHPPSQERLEANRRKVASFPQGGDAGVDRYRAALARTMRAKPAYDAYDAGRKALSEKHADVALTKAEQAIRLEPDEGHFYALKGDALLVQKKNAAASDAYTAAIQRNDSFFYYYLQRGLVAERQHDDGSARRDLETSLKMLPTGPAYYSLGNIALRARQYDAARQYFASAAGAEGPVGEAATLSLMKLELSGNPEKYLRKQAALDAGGKLVVAIANATKVPVTGLVVSVQYLDAGGQTREFRRELSGTLAGGQQLQVATGLGPFQNNNQFRIAIVGARVAE